MGGSASRAAAASVAAAAIAATSVAAVDGRSILHSEMIMARRSGRRVISSVGGSASKRSFESGGWICYKAAAASVAAAAIAAAAASSSAIVAAVDGGSILQMDDSLLVTVMPQVSSWHKAAIHEAELARSCKLSSTRNTAYWTAWSSRHQYWQACYARRAEQGLLRLAD